ncbi:MBL fold metallo-hydrolase [Patescibacteria group bacterium]|nr:MBL fold metallo-hydrolase [Patescibacteria group bacterium]
MKKLLFLIFLGFFLQEMLFKWPDQQFLHLIICDVGQGDAILLSFGQMQALIDTGPDESVLICLNKHMPFWDKKIDVLVLTHFDDDHVGGFKDLSQVYAIKYLFLPMTDYKDSEAFLELKEQISSLQKLGTMVKEPFLGQQIAFSEMSSGYQAKYNSTETLFLSFLTPFALDREEYSVLEENKAFLWQKPENSLSAEDWQKLAYKMSDNNGSIAIFAQFGELKVLLLGDLESTRELALINSGLITEVDIQKVGHHGSKTSSSMEFLLKTRPEIALISCGLNNKFKHPNQETLDNFESINTQVLRTDDLGEIELVLDGQKFWLKNKKQILF